VKSTFAPWCFSFVLCCAAAKFGVRFDQHPVGFAILYASGMLQGWGLAFWIRRGQKGA